MTLSICPYCGDLLSKIADSRCNKSDHSFYWHSNSYWWLMDTTNHIIVNGYSIYYFSNEENIILFESKKSIEEAIAIFKSVLKIKAFI